jgi:hypothetical protein
MVWVCPVCSAVIWAERSRDIGMAAALHIGQGGKVAMMTTTARHSLDDRLRGLVGYMRGGWDGIWRGRAGMRLREDLGLVGFIRVMEVTYGVNGWHPHFHTALFLPGDATNESLNWALEDAFIRWSAGVVKAGGKVPQRQAQDVRLFGSGDVGELAAYLSKQFVGPMLGASGSASGAERRAHLAHAARTGESLGREMTQGARKRARKVYGTSPVWVLLDDARILGDADALDLWHEYERATYRVKGVVWSQGLRARFHLGKERSDEEIVDDDRGGEAVLALTDAGLARMINDFELVPEMQDAYEVAGYAGLRMFLDTNGVEYEVIEEMNHDDYAV